MKQNRRSILITGGGGVTGRAIARSLRLSKHCKDFDLVACDIYHNEYGLFEGLFDRCYKIHHVESNEYLSDFATLCRIEKPSAVLIMTEKEALFWTKHKPEFPTMILPEKFSEEVISKYQLYRNLEATEFVPKFQVVENNEKGIDMLANSIKNEPVWLRSFDAGSSSGKGACYVSHIDKGVAWFKLNPQIKQFLLSEYLPGRNFACCMLYAHGKLLQYAIYERLEYFMPHLSVSGVTGNISRGKLVNETQVFHVSDQVVRYICEKFNEVPHGVVTVDLKGDNLGFPKVTEINLRHTAATSAFAVAGWNMAEFQVLAVLGKTELIPKHEPCFPEDNMIFRDIDGLPLYIEQYNRMKNDKIIHV